MRTSNLKSQISDWRDRHAAVVSSIVPAALLILLPLTSYGAQPSVPKPLTDGTILTGVDGKLVPGGAADKWFFDLVADANSISGPVIAGTRFELLPCRTLELLIADVNDRFTPTYRLSVRVTRFEGKNFLFPTYYLPLSKSKSAEAQDTEQGQPHVLREPAKSREPDPELAIPPEVMDKLNDRRFVRELQRESGKSDRPELPKSLDRMLVDALGRIEPVASGLQPPASRRYAFIPDAFGWGVGGTRYGLLPCATLEQALQIQAASPDSVRFSAAGIATEFKGTKYLLLQRMIRTYDHGNFVK